MVILGGFAKTQICKIEIFSKMSDLGPCQWRKQLCCWNFFNPSTLKKVIAKKLPAQLHLKCTLVQHKLLRLSSMIRQGCILQTFLLTSKMLSLTWGIQLCAPLFGNLVQVFMKKLWSQFLDSIFIVCNKFPRLSYLFKNVDVFDYIFFGLSS